jgi:LDH2 family malate/lactate/ureidoglycolate dehydrogenase
MSDRLRREGKRFPGTWALDAAGRPTDDPTALFTDPPGTILPTGGTDHGHKGYGRAESPTGWGASVFVQAIDPSAFGGIEAFRRETSWTAAACRNCPPAPGIDAVRLPGQRGLERKRRALAEGVSLYPGIMAALAPHAERLGVNAPETMVANDERAN